MSKNKGCGRGCDVPNWEEIQKEWETIKITLAALAFD